MEANANKPNIVFIYKRYAAINTLKLAESMLIFSYTCEMELFLKLRPSFLLYTALYEKVNILEGKYL